MSSLPTVRTAIPDIRERRPWTGGRRVVPISYEQFMKGCRAGVFPEDRTLELIEGRVVEMPPQGPKHFVATTKVYEVLRRIAPPGYFVPPTPQLRLGEGSAPMPDACIVPGRIEDYRHAVPTSAILVVEVSDTTLADDRLDKASLYASAGLQDYWIVNCVDEVVEVYRDPRPDETHPSGWAYGPARTLRRGETVQPLAVPGAAVPVDDLLP